MFISRNKTYLAHSGLLKKMALALSLSATTVLSPQVLAENIKQVVVQLDEEVHKLEVVANAGNEARVFIDTNGDRSEFFVSHEDLQNSERLSEILADLPEEKREKVMKLLADLSHSGLSHIGGLHRVEELIDGEQEIKVMVIDDDSMSSDDMKSIVKKVMVHGGGDHMFKFKHKGKMTADIIAKMLDHGEYTQDELDVVQQALDAKR